MADQRTDARPLLARLVDVEAGETAPLLWSAALFFSVLCGYFVVVPVRETWGIEHGNYYRQLWTGTAVCTLVATPVFGWLASWMRRRVLVSTVYALGIVFLLSFWGVQVATAGQPEPAVGYAFYIWLSVFNLFATAVFWGYMVDLWRHAQSRRLFGFVSVGGTLGALCGSWLVNVLNQPLGTVNLLLVSAGLFAAAILCVGRLNTLFGAEPERAAADFVPKVGWSEAVAGVRLFAKNRYMVAIGVFLAAQTLVSAVLYIESRVAVGEWFPTRGDGLTPEAVQTNRDARTAFFAFVNVGYNALALFVQLFWTGRLVRWIGLGAMLAVLPIVNFGGFALLAFAPTLVAYGVFEVLQRASKFAVMKPAREILFTVLSREEKYKAKQFLDTAIYRSTDAVWAWLQNGMSVLFGSFGIKVFVVLPVCVGWAAVGRWLGAEDARRASLDAGDEARAELVRAEPDLE